MPPVEGQRLIYAAFSVMWRRDRATGRMSVIEDLNWPMFGGAEGRQKAQDAAERYNAGQPLGVARPAGLSAP